jgi:hypothetical protein
VYETGSFYRILKYSTKWLQFNTTSVQFQILDVTQTEKDASGKCQVSYKSLDPRTFLKTKTDCVSGKTVPFILHPDKVSACLNCFIMYSFEIQGTGMYLVIDRISHPCIRNEVSLSFYKVCSLLTIQNVLGVLPSLSCVLVILHGYETTSLRAQEYTI